MAYQVPVTSHTSRMTELEEERKSVESYKKELKRRWVEGEMTMKECIMSWKYQGWDIMSFIEWLTGIDYEN